MRTGWFKFHRQMLDNPICIKDAETFLVWCYILTEAKYEDGERVLFKNEEITLSKGQLLKTTTQIANELHIKEMKVYRILKLLENEKQIVKQTSNKNTLITVLNWEKYQSCEEQNEKQMKDECKTNVKPVKDECKTSEKQMKDECKTDVEPSYYNKEYKKERIEEGEEIQEREEKEEGKNIISSNSNELDCQTQDVRRVLEAWNELGVYGIKTVGKLKSGTQRYTMLRARIREYGIDDVLAAIDNIKSSDFLQGKHSGKSWQITFDWFVRPNNFPKVLEGNYSGNANSQANGYTQMPYGNSREVQFANLMEQIRRDEENDG